MIDNSAYAAGLSWGMHYERMDDLGRALVEYDPESSMLPRQRASFERGFRKGVELAPMQEVLRKSYGLSNAAVNG